MPPPSSVRQIARALSICSERGSEIAESGIEKRTFSSRQPVRFDVVESVLLLQSFSVVLLGAKSSARVGAISHAERTWKSFTQDIALYELLFGFFSSCAVTTSENQQQEHEAECAQLSEDT